MVARTAQHDDDSAEGRALDAALSEQDEADQSHDVDDGDGGDDDDDDAAPPPSRPRGRPRGSKTSVPRQPRAAVGDEPLSIHPSIAAQQLQQVIGAAQNGVPLANRQTQRARPERAPLIDPAVQRTLIERQNKAYEEIDDILANLDFDRTEYEVHLERLSPDVDQNGTPCSGFLCNYHHKVTRAEVQERWGGGTYSIRVMGPHPAHGKWGYIKQGKFRISGHPKPSSPTSKPQDDNAIRAIYDAHERNTQRLIDVMTKQQQAPSVIEAIIPSIVPVIKEAMSKSDETLKSILLLQEGQRKADEERRREERERDERRREEDRRREEERRIREEKEREERRREERERDERRREEQRREDERREAQRREELAAERERQREERERMREEARAEAAERQRQHERELQQATERMRQEQQQQQQFMAMMNNFHQVQMDMLFKRAADDGGSIDKLANQIAAIKELTGIINGDKEEDTVDRVIGGVERVAKSVVPMAQRFLQDRQAAGQKFVANPGAPGRQVRQIAVDLPPRAGSLPSPSAVSLDNVDLPRQDEDRSPQQTQPQPQAAQQPTDQQDAQEQTVRNDITAILAFSPKDDIQQSVVKLIKNIDFCIQRNLPPQEIVEKVVNPFQESNKFVANMIAGMDIDSLLSFIEQNVPSDWVIMSPRGEQTIREVFNIWLGDEEGEE